MAETKVYLLDGGSLVIDGFHIFWNRGPAGPVRFPCYSVLIEHADGRFLFDTGFDCEHVEKVLPFEQPDQAPEQTIPGQLHALGLKPGDISHVINSHYHFDHCGGNKHCTCAMTVCHKAEFDAAKAPQPFEKLGYSDLSFFGSGDGEGAGAGAAHATIDSADDMFTPKFELIEGDQEIAKGVWLFETPGHTAGHYSLMVELAGRRPMLFTADACYTRKNLEMGCISSFHLDPTASLESMNRLNRLAEEHDAELFFSHDPESYPDYVKAPGYYT